MTDRPERTAGVTARPERPAGRRVPDPAGGPDADRAGGPDPRRRVPAWAAALLLAITGAALVLAALLAGRAGPLVAHPPTVQPEMPTPPTAGRPTRLSAPSTAPLHQSEPSGAWLWWVAVALGGLILLMIVLWLVRALRRPARIAAPPVAMAGAAVAPAALGMLGDEAAVDLTDARTFDPERAADDIIASWTALQDAVARAGHRRAPSSTPTEFLDGLTDRLGDPVLGAADAAAVLDRSLVGRPGPGGSLRAAAVLLRLYHRARFDTAALAPGAATAARAAARTLLQAWDLIPGGRHG